MKMSDNSSIMSTVTVNVHDCGSKIKSNAQPENMTPIQVEV